MIRLLQTSDTPNLMEFFFADRKVQQDERFNFELEDFEKMLTYSHIFQYVYEVNEKIVGYLAGYNMGVWAYIDVLIVKSTDRNKSIGTTLIEKFLEDNQDKNWVRLETSCYAHDTDSIQYVRNRGFNIEQTLAWFGKAI